MAFKDCAEKLTSEGDQLHRAITQHAAFSQSIVQLTKIVSDGMTTVSKSDGTLTFLLHGSGRVAPLDR